MIGQLRVITDKDGVLVFPDRRGTDGRLNRRWEAAKVLEHGDYAIVVGIQSAEPYHPAQHDIILICKHGLCFALDDIIYNATSAVNTSTALLIE